MSRKLSNYARSQRRPLNVDERKAILDALEAAGIAHCTHPDCDPKQPSCATNYVFLKAKQAAEATYRIGLGQSAIQDELSGKIRPGGAEG